jgi:hypothetical protein
MAALLEGLYGSIARGPWRVSKPLHDELAGLRVARRSQYRVVFRADERDLSRRPTPNGAAARSSRGQARPSEAEG